MDQATFGLIGVGGIAQSQHLPNMARAPHVRLKTACDLREDVLAAMVEKYGVPHSTPDYKELLADPEIQAVVVATREDMQAKLAIEALQAGKHVYVEKPLAATSEECEAVVAAQQASGKHVAVDFNRRFAPAYRRAKELAAGDDGPKNVHYRISDTYCRGWGKGCPSGIRVIHEVCHVFDLLRWLTDSDVTSIYTVLSRSDDEIFTLTFASGCVASITSSGYVTTDLPKERLELISDAGTVIVEEFVELRAFGHKGAKPVERYAGHSHPDKEFSHRLLFEKVGADALYGMRRVAWELQTGDSRACPDQAERDRFLSRGQMWNYMVDKGWLAALDHFAECVATGATPQNAGARDGLMASRLAHAAIQSRETGEIVRLDA